MNSLKNTHGRVPLSCLLTGGWGDPGVMLHWSLAAEAIAGQTNGQGTHPLQELRSLLLLVATSSSCYFVFLAAPFPPLLFLIQLEGDTEPQVRAEE